jgi:hypothetical protein
MEAVIKKTDETLVYYDAHREVYRKVFRPAFRRQLKFSLGIERYPGHHYSHIAGLLNTAGILTPTVVECSRFSVTTEAVEGKALFEELLTPDRLRVQTLLNKYTDIIAAIVVSQLFFADFHFKNFLVNGGNIYALDLDNYKTGGFSAWRLRRLLKNSGYRRVCHFVSRLTDEARRRGNQAIIHNLATTAQPEAIWQNICLRINERKRQA